jgi:hypothetical protein
LAVGPLLASYLKTSYDGITHGVRLMIASIYFLDVSLMLKPLMYALHSVIYIDEVERIASILLIVVVVPSDEI